MRWTQGKELEALAVWPALCVIFPTVCQKLESGNAALHGWRLTLCRTLATRPVAVDQLLSS